MEKVLFGDSEWYKMRQSLTKWQNDQAQDLINDSQLPFSIKKAAMTLHSNVLESLDLKSLDRRKTNQKIV